MHSESNSSHSDEGRRAEAAALRLLARREHSVDELTRKLLAKGFEQAAVRQVVERLTTKRLVSDQRFAAGLVHHRARRGQGPVRIRADLRQQGITDQAIEDEFRSAGVDWNQLAAQARRRRFGAPPPRNLSERAKQARFLQYRGFSAEQIRAAFAAAGDDEATDIGRDADPDWLD